MMKAERGVKTDDLEFAWKKGKEGSLSYSLSIYCSSVCLFSVCDEPKLVLQE